MSVSLGLVGECSFAGVHFGTVQAQGQYGTEPGQDTLSDATPVPYGGTFSLQLGGQKPQEKSLQIMVDLADWPAFKGKRAQSGPLVLHNGATWTATLLRYDDPLISYQRGYVLTTAVWIL